MEQKWIMATASHNTTLEKKGLQDVKINSSQNIARMCIM